VIQPHEQGNCCNFAQVLDLLLHYASHVFAGATHYSNPPGPQNSFAMLSCSLVLLS
jgi:hypothetical protein